MAAEALYGSYRWLILRSLLGAGVLLVVIAFWLLVFVIGRMFAVW